MRLLKIGSLLIAAFLILTGCATTPSASTEKAEKPSGPRTVLAQGGRIAITDGAGKTVFVTSGPGDLVPAASPDGSMIAFTRVGQSDVAGTYIVNTDGTGEKKVAPVVASLSQPVWSPDGKSLAIRDTSATGRGIWVVKADGSDLQRVFEGDCSAPVWSSDGKSIAVAELEKIKDLSLDTGIYLVDLSSKDKKLISQGAYGAVALSPDGRNIAAVTATKQGLPSDLVLVNPADGKATSLAGSVADGAWAPTWSPDGKLVTGAIATKDGQQLVAMSPSGTEAKVLAKGDFIGTPVWSTDGNSLTVSLVPPGSKQREVVRVAADGAQPQKEVATGDAPCNLGGTIAPAKEVAAGPKLAGIRRADVKFSKGSWG